MTTLFDEREKAFEKKFALDQELSFKVTVRRNKLLGLWAAEIMGMAMEEAAGYARAVIKADFEEAGEGDLIRKLLADFAAKGVPQTDGHVREALARLGLEAVRQVEREASTPPEERA